MHKQTATQLIPNTDKSDSPRINQVSSYSPTASASYQVIKNQAGPLKPADVLRLQQTVGNQAVQRLLAQRNKLNPNPAAGTLQREIMSVKEFQKLTAIRAASRNKIKVVDKALTEFHKKGELFGKSSQYLTALLESIESWLEVRGTEKKNGRRAGVLELQAQARAEKDLVGEQAVVEPPKVKASSEGGTLTAPGKNATFDDFDGKQYRVFGRKPNRIIEEVKKKIVDDKPVYFAIGQVTDFQSTMPVVRYYDNPVSLGDWYPRVTHLNGMNVKPQSGIDSALALQESINQTLDEKMQENGVALNQDAVDVLYTYSAQRGEGLSGFAGDVFDCLKGKVGMDDTVTLSQTDLMLEAVNRKKRTTVSAHSRGTIKTDNAVRNAHKQLVELYAVAARKEPEVIKKARELAHYIANNGMGFDFQTALSLAIEGQAQQFADKLARENMDKYIQLVYAGNAVSYPSSVLPVEMFVGSSDVVSLGVGTYTKAGAKIASGNSKTKLNKQSGGHSFTGNYARPVGQTIGIDIMGRPKPEEDN
jgi:hypothetical protein